MLGESFSDGALEVDGMAPWKTLFPTTRQVVFHLHVDFKECSCRLLAKIFETSLEVVVLVVRSGTSLRAAVENAT